MKRLGQEQAFNRPKCKKIKLWNDIAKEINKDTKEAFSLTGTLCDNKYRNLLKTYKINKKKQKSSGESAINWEYFSDFDGVLGCKASIDPPDNTIYDTLGNDSNKDSENNENTSRDLNLNLDDVNSQPRPSNISKEVGASKQNKTMKYQQYLYLKNKREEEKEKFQQKKWDEEKELRGEETAAILKLVEALKKK